MVRLQNVQPPPRRRGATPAPAIHMRRPRRRVPKTQRTAALDPGSLPSGQRLRQRARRTSRSRTNCWTSGDAKDLWRRQKRYARPRSQAPGRDLYPWHGTLLRQRKSDCTWRAVVQGPRAAVEVDADRQRPWPHVQEPKLLPNAMAKEARHSIRARGSHFDQPRLVHRTTAVQMLMVFLHPFPLSTSGKALPKDASISRPTRAFPSRWRFWYIPRSHVV